MSRQIVLDTETTGIDPKAGHRVIEIGAVEMVNRRLTGKTFHQYLQPDREVDEGAFRVHGISNDFLADKPRFNELVEEFIEFVRGAELIIHNAPFDVGFINSEFKIVNAPVKQLEDISSITDTLQMARDMHPGQKNSLDALCKRYDIDNSRRTYHGALLDSEILASVYLAMTGGQSSLSLSLDEQVVQQTSRSSADSLLNFKPINGYDLRVHYADSTELAAHQARLDKISSANEAPTVWQRLEDE